MFYLGKILWRAGYPNNEGHISIKNQRGRPSLFSHDSNEESCLASTRKNSTILKKFHLFSPFHFLFLLSSFFAVLFHLLSDSAVGVSRTILNLKTWIAATFGHAAEILLFKPCGIPSVVSYSSFQLPHRQTSGLSSPSLSLRACFLLHNFSLQALPIPHAFLACLMLPSILGITFLLLQAPNLISYSKQQTSFNSSFPAFRLQIPALPDHSLCVSQSWNTPNPFP